MRNQPSGLPPVSPRQMASSSRASEFCSSRVVVVGSILFGKKRDAESIQANPAVFAGGAAVKEYGSEGTLKLPGTIVLVSVFFLAFVLYYFVNWKFLSEVWPLS